LIIQQRRTLLNRREPSAFDGGNQQTGKTHMTSYPNHRSGSVRALNVREIQHVDR
jgi:hypothetical protein